MRALLVAVILVVGVAFTQPAHAILKMGTSSRLSYTVDGQSSAAQADAVKLYLFVAGAEYAAALVQADDVAYEHARWSRTHECEEGGQGWHPAGSTRDGYFEGGLGIAASLYQSIAGHSALQDDEYHQEKIADIALARVGAGAWACPTP